MEDKCGRLSELSETRLAVVFSDGVSLAVYESGVALEFYRLVKGEGVYERLKKEIGPVIIDVITGTSAGGMNGVLLKAVVFIPHVSESYRRFSGHRTVQQGSRRPYEDHGILRGSCWTISRKPYH
jgi:hypothetical protein